MCDLQRMVSLTHDVGSLPCCSIYKYFVSYGLINFMCVSIHSLAGESSICIHILFIIIIAMCIYAHIFRYMASFLLNL